MKRHALLFALATFLTFSLLYALIVVYTPLSTIQIVGTGVAFLLGWAGLAYAGGQALEKMLSRRRLRTQPGRA